MMPSFGTVTWAWGELCVYCGDAASTIDHVVPPYRSGPQSLANLRPACSWCNGRKKDATPEEWLGPECPEWLTGFSSSTPARQTPGMRPSARAIEDRTGPQQPNNRPDGTRGRRRKRRRDMRVEELRALGLPEGPPPLFYRPIGPDPDPPQFPRNGVVIRPLPDGPVGVESNERTTA